MVCSLVCRSNVAEAERKILMKDSTIENAIYNYARTMLPKLRKSYGSECHAWMIEECKNIIALSVDHDIQNGTEFTMLQEEIVRLESKHTATS